MHTIKFYPDPDHALSDELKYIRMESEKIDRMFTAFGFNVDKQKQRLCALATRKEAAVSQFRECFPQYTTCKVTIVDLFIRNSRISPNEHYFEIKVPCS